MAKRNVTGTVTGVFLWTVVIGGSLVFGYMYAGNHTLPLPNFHLPGFGQQQSNAAQQAPQPAATTTQTSSQPVTPAPAPAAPQASEYVAPGAPKIAITEVPATQPPTQDTDTGSGTDTSTQPSTTTVPGTQPTPDTATPAQSTGNDDNQPAQPVQQPAVQPAQTPDQTPDQSAGTTPNQYAPPTYTPPVQGNPPRRGSTLDDTEKSGPGNIVSPDTYTPQPSSAAPAQPNDSDSDDTESSQTGITPDTDSIYRVQAGTFTSEKNARILADALRVRGYTAIARPSRYGGQTIYKVQVGVYENRATAEDIATDLLREGYPAYVSGN